LQKRYESILVGLADEDFQVRAGAQKQLEQISWQNLDSLRQLAVGTSDPEVKSRLASRVAAIEDELAMNPAPLSVNLKDSSLYQVCTALRAAGLIVDSAPARPDEPLYSLDAKNLSFAALIQQLNTQHPLEISGGYGAPTLSPTPPSRQIFFTPQAMLMNRWISPVGGAGAPGNRYVMSLGVLIDPRVMIAGCVAQFDRAEDERGNPIAFQLVDLSPPPSALWSHSMSLEVAAGSKQIKVAKGVLKVTIALRQDTVEFDDPEKHVNEEIKLGKGASLTIQSFEATADSVKWTCGMGPRPDVIEAALASHQIDAPAELKVAGRLIDATGRTITTVHANGGGGISGKNVAKLPIKLQLTVPIKTREVIIPFELHDLPLK
jgi:hypothetical protein